MCSTGWRFMCPNGMMLRRLYMKLLINILFLETCLTIYTRLETMLDVAIAKQVSLTRLFESHCCSQELYGFEVITSTQFYQNLDLQWWKSFTSGSGWTEGHHGYPTHQYMLRSSLERVDCVPLVSIRRFIYNIEMLVLLIAQLLQEWKLVRKSVNHNRWWL